MPDFTINDKGRAGWYRTSWQDDRGRLRTDITSAWHFSDGRSIVRVSVKSPIPKAVCGYAGSHFTSPREWSPEPDPAKLIGPVCSRCRRQIGR